MGHHFLFEAYTQQSIYKKSKMVKILPILSLFFAISMKSYSVTASKIPLALQQNQDCIPDYAGPCYEDDECCTKHCSNFICRPPSDSKVTEKQDCIPDYAGPCYEDSECCTNHCSNFICRPPSDDKINEKEDCIPDYAGPCYEDDECCTKHCSNFICRPPSDAKLKEHEKCIPD